MAELTDLAPSWRQEVPDRFRDSLGLLPVVALVLAWRFLPGRTILPLAHWVYAGLLKNGWDIPDAHFTSYFLYYLADTLIAISLVLIGARAYRLPNQDLGWRWPVSRWSIIWAALLAVPAFVAAYALDILPDAVFFQRLPTLRWTIDSGWGLWDNPTAYHRFFTRALMTPVSEELLYRGFVQGVLRQRYGPSVAVFATAAIFAGLHPFMGTGHFAGHIVTALLLGLLRERTGSLAPPMAAHFLWNQWASVVLFRPIF